MSHPARNSAGVPDWYWWSPIERITSDFAASTPVAALLAEREGGWMSPTAATFRGREDGGGKTAHDHTRGSASTLPAASRAHTRNWWRPSRRPVTVFGLRHGTATPRSRRQVNVAASFAVNENDAVALWVTFAGMPDSVVLGAVRSTGALAAVLAGAVVNEWPGNQATAFSRSPLTPICQR